MNTGSDPAGDGDRSGGVKTASENIMEPVGGRIPEDQQRIVGKDHSDPEQVRYQHRTEQSDSDLLLFRK